MSVAIMVMGANAPQILRCHVKWFQDDRYKFYIHVDSKKNLDDYASHVGDWGNLKYISNRKQIFWAGFNMVEATIALLKEALIDVSNEHFILVSDDTLPIADTNAIASVCDRDSGMITINKYNVDHPYMKRYSQFYFMDSRFSTPRLTRLDERGVTNADIDDFEGMKSLMVRGKKPLDCYYNGSQWWKLSRRHVLGILDLFDRDYDLTRSFKYSTVSDESYFQTAFKTLFENEEHQSSPMYVDWLRKPTPFVYNSIIELKDIDRANKYYIRKIRSDNIELALQIGQMFSLG